MILPSPQPRASGSSIEPYFLPYQLVASSDPSSLRFGSLRSAVSRLKTYS
jgi:hypothetical protein